MSPPTPTVAFFDIGGTLASVALSPGGDRIEHLGVHPDVPGVLEDLRRRGARLGIVSDPGPVPHEEVDRALEGPASGASSTPTSSSTAPRTPRASSSGPWRAPVPWTVPSSSARTPANGHTPCGPGCWWRRTHGWRSRCSGETTCATSG